TTELRCVRSRTLPASSHRRDRHTHEITATLQSPWESTTGLFKTELIKPRRPWKTLSDAEPATAEYADWYNHRRLHGETGHVPPVEYENNHYLTTTKSQVTTNV
ncbi:IS3 family transposase, partial [Streptomyces sp. NPDC001817]|uniref:IS3 family transposase n=1 Tax=Streptomyces sp. NPDC001817 TaxID=3154398 RepID=UPI00331FF911